MTNKIKQNKKYLVIISIIAIIVSILAFPVSAVSENNVDFSGQPIPIVGSNPTFAQVRNGYRVGQAADGSGMAIFAASESEDIYVFVYGTTAPYTVRYCSYSSAPNAICFGTTNTLYTVSCTYYDSSSSLYYGDFSISVNQPLAPQYITAYDGMTDLRSYLNSIDVDPVVPPSTPHDISFSLPFGNVAYVDLGSTSIEYAISRHYTGSAYFPELSNLFNNMFGDDYGSWGYASTLPTSSSQLVAPITKFEFVKTGSTNLLGQSHNGAWSQTSTAPSRYLVLYNPLNLAGGQGDFVTYNFVIPDAYDVTVFPLNTSFNLNNGISSYDETLGDPITGTIDVDTGQIIWTDSNGDSSTGPTIGGQNAINNESTSVVEWLKQIANDIVTFLNRSLDSVNILISGGTAFITRIGNLYSWLPSSVYSVIVSAITLVFAIGVIKVFL